MFQIGVAFYVLQPGQHLDQDPKQWSGVRSSCQVSKTSAVMTKVDASDCSGPRNITAMMTLWVRLLWPAATPPCWVTSDLPMLARPAAAWLLMLASSLHQVSASASSESEPGLDTGLNSSTSVIHSGKQRLTVLNLNFWGLGWPWGSDKDVR